MKWTALVGVLVVLLMLVLSSVSVLAQGAVDQYGYNYTARLFNGPFGDADRDSDPDTYYGNPTDSYGYYDTDGNYHEVLVTVAESQLRMKWSKAWQMAVFGPDGIRKNGDEKPWNASAWCTNHVEGTGTVYNVDGSVLYQGHLTILSTIRWVGDTSGYTNPIWGQFAVLHKVVGGQGETFAEIPTGFGAPLPC